MLNTLLWTFVLKISPLVYPASMKLISRRFRVNQARWTNYIPYETFAWNTQFLFIFQAFTPANFHIPKAVVGLFQQHVQHVIPLGAPGLAKLCQRVPAYYLEALSDVTSNVKEQLLSGKIFINDSKTENLSTNLSFWDQSSINLIHFSQIIPEKCGMMLRNPIGLAMCNP